MEINVILFVLALVGWNFVFFACVKIRDMNQHSTVYPSPQINRRPSAATPKYRGNDGS